LQRFFIERNWNKDKQPNEENHLNKESPHPVPINFQLLKETSPSYILTL